MKPEYGQKDFLVYYGDGPELFTELWKEKKFFSYFSFKYGAYFPFCIKKGLYYLRLQKWMTSALGYVWRPHHEKVEIDLTYECTLSCETCNRVCGRAPSHERIACAQIEKFITESVMQKRTWRWIKLLGGEPTLHPELFDIIDLLITYRKKQSPHTEIILATNGYGDHVTEVLAKVPPEIVIDNSAKKSSVQHEHIDFNQAPIDNSQFRQADFSFGCILPFRCGISLTPFGYYPCSSAGGVDRVCGFDVGKKELPPVDTDWAREVFRTLCPYCGYFYPLRRSLGTGEISPTWAQALERYHTEKPTLTAY